MKAEFINPFITSTVNVLKTMAHVEPKPGKPAIKTTRVTWGAITGLVGMAGDEVTGNMLISFDEASILKIVSNMLGEQFTTLSHDVVDAVGEITNMITGGAKKEFGEHGFTFSMATPMVITGKGVEIAQLSKAPVITIPFDIETGSFVVEANLAPRR